MIHPDIAEADRLASALIKEMKSKGFHPSIAEAALCFTLLDIAFEEKLPIKDFEDILLATYHAYAECLFNQKQGIMDKAIRKSFEKVKKTASKEEKKLVKQDIKRDKKCEHDEKLAKKK